MVKKKRTVITDDAEGRVLIYRELVERFVEESNLEKPTTKRTLAECLAAMVIQRDVYLDDVCQGKITAVTGRLLPGIVSNIKRLCETLGVVVVEPEEDAPL